MLSRITFVVLLVFWLTMTYLLWRSEYLAQNQPGSSVPVTLVWRKILNAPDNSMLQIVHDGHKVGFCQVSSSIGQELANSKILSDDAVPPDGFAPVQTGTRLALNGNVFLENAGNRLKFDCDMRLTTNNADWQEFSLKFGQANSTWQVHSVAREQAIHLDIDDDQGKTSRLIKFSDFQNPQALLRDFDVSTSLSLLAMMGPVGGLQQTNTLSMVGLKWSARNDWMKIGRTPVRVYRLEASVLEKYRMRMLVSQVGEIVRVELPDGWMLVNNDMMAF